MSQLAANPYINFQGHAREAMEFYQKALGGNLELTTFDSQESPDAASSDDAIMHAVLQSDGVTIMSSDGRPDYPPTVGDNMAISLSGSDHERLTQAFDALSEGGNVKQPLNEESWGDTFGYFTDKFGINWMVNITRQ